VRFRHILVLSLAAAIAANLTSHVAWEVADGAEDGPYFLLRISLVVGVLAGAWVTWRARGAWHEALSAGLFSAMAIFVLAWVPITVLALLNPPS
jgi:hypothetical protein